MKQILFLLFFAQVISAQTDCGSDIAPKNSSGMAVIGYPCRFKAPGIDTCLTNIQDPKNKIEWVHQNGYSYYEIVDNNTGRVESSGYNPVSSTSAVGAFQETMRAPGEIVLNGQRFYQYVPAGIKPDKNGTWDAGYGDAAPAFCGCLRRVELKTETLYAGKAKSLVSGSKSVSVTQNENGTVTIKANEWAAGKNQKRLSDLTLAPFDTVKPSTCITVTDKGFVQPVYYYDQLIGSKVIDPDSFQPVTYTGIIGEYVIVGSDMIDAQDFLGVEYYDSDMSIYKITLTAAAVHDAFVCDVKQLSERPYTRRTQSKSEFFQITDAGNGSWHVTAHTKQFGKSKVIPASYFDRVVNFVHEFFSAK